MLGAKADAKQIFLGALDCASNEEVAIYLRNACGNDAALRARVEQLLAARREAGSFLGGAATGSVDGESLLHDAVGSMIGPYKVLQQIGEGGFGVVYLAEQERPVRRQVALKILKPGMDSREVVARFDAERQALALMDHPNIATVYDAGATDQGRPYCVMELVHGVPITEYCDQCQLTTRERLELFVAVCQAVQHAHQKGIIHRDLKPTNVLVEIRDGRPTPKIIDFGVAKAVNQQLTEHTLLTAFAQILGTPLYMSPEQAELSPLGVDTRSDIYSLGVLLYELLTGTTPFDKERIRNTSYDELRRIIREEEPPRPSARISTLAAGEATTLAERRRTDRRRLQQAISGELDWIVMKCLEKDRNRRYETASELGRDVERFLADEPVAACQPSAAYRFRKFARRNRAMLGVACVAATMLVVLLVGLAVSNRLISAERSEADWQRQLAEQRAVEEELASKSAQAEAAKSKEVVALMRDMLSAAHPDSPGGKDFTVRELLDEFSVELGERLINQPEVEATLRQIIGSAYTRLGLTDQAEPHLRRSLELLRHLHGDEDLAVANGQRYLAWNLLERNRADQEVERLVREALSVYHRQSNADQALEAQWLLVLSLDGQSRQDEAEAAAEESLHFARQNNLAEHATVPNLLHQLAWINIRKGDYVNAEQLARESVALHRRVHGESHPETAFGWTYLGAALHRQSKFAAAEDCYRKALEIFRGRLPEGHHYILPTLVDLGMALHSQGKLAEQIALWREVLRHRPDFAPAHNALAWALSTCPDEQLRDPVEAMNHARQAVAIAPADGMFWNTLGVAQYRAGNWPEAVLALQKSVELRDGGDANDWFFLAMAEWQSGNETAAREWYSQATEWIERTKTTSEDVRHLHDEAASMIEKHKALE